MTPTRGRTACRALYTCDGKFHFNSKETEKILFNIYILNKKFSLENHLFT